MITIGSVSKLGKQISQSSRPVGLTCLSSCPHYGTSCYAWRFENFREKVKASWAKGLDEDFADLEKTLNKPGVKAHRLHVGGDFCRDGKIDRPYIARLLRTLRRIRRNGNQKPLWTYTHAWRELEAHLGYLQRLGVVVYASVHSLEECYTAFFLGYRVAMDAGRRADKKTDKTGRANGLLRCPEQIGTGHTCGSCGFCWKGRPTAVDRNILLFRH